MYKPVYHQVAIGDTVAVMRNVDTANPSKGQQKKTGEVMSIGNNTLDVKVGAKTHTVKEAQVIGVIK